MNPTTDAPARPDSPQTMELNRQELDSYVRRYIARMSPTGHGFAREEVVNTSMLYAWVLLDLREMQTFSYCTALMAALPNADIEAVHAGAEEMPWQEPGLGPDEIVRRLAATVVVARIRQQPEYRFPIYDDVEGFTYLGSMAHPTSGVLADLWVANNGSHVQVVYLGMSSDLNYPNDPQTDPCAAEAWRRHKRRVALSATSA